MSTTYPDKVYTMTDWYDGPREGVADYQGKPHHYRCQTGYEPYDEPSRYRLTPLDEEAFQLEMEDWAIWLRYCTACQEGRATAEMHPALPEDRPRHKELKPLIQAKLASLSTLSVLATAQFSRGSETVTWTLLPEAPQ
ncbi:hypothetical protein [Hymenobacter edaphi]|uniref:Uncharacterized protein n=1 Tax=Hymenobacter edaphi TaxID=2211146 RepID=A0A328BNQ4_9BACT|nr:hypothetical protein [Hymenobacter edaphi]RAK68325.1 hypothetical protein DLM85_09875 [Hymenobacter edaphi]